GSLRLPPGRRRQQATSTGRPDHDDRVRRPPRTGDRQADLQRRRSGEEPMRPRRMVPLLAAVLVLSWAAAVCAAEDVDTERDPLECVNRKIFWFNDKLDVYVLAPVATGWEKVSPRSEERRVGKGGRSCG